MVNLVDLLRLSSILALETKLIWFRKPNDGPHYRTSMSMILLISPIVIVMIIILIVMMSACMPVSSMSQIDWESGSAGSVWLTMRLCTMTRINYGKHVRTHSNNLWTKAIDFICILLLNISMHSVNIDSYLIGWFFDLAFISWGLIVLQQSFFFLAVFSS